MLRLVDRIAARTRNALCNAIVVLAGCMTAFPAHAIVLDAVTRGHYSPSGHHDPGNSGNDNYLVGDCRGLAVCSGITVGPGTSPDLRDFRSFFVFVLGSAQNVPITSARLHIFNGIAGFSSTGSSSETLALFSVDSFGAGVRLSQLQSGTGGQGAWLDLGTGTVLGQYTVTAADNGGYIDVELNAAGLAALNAATDAFAIGGALTSLNGASDNEFVIGHSRGLSADVQLIINEPRAVPVPIPAPIGLLLVGGLAALPLSARRRRRVAAASGR